MIDSPTANVAIMGAFVILMGGAFLWGVKPRPQATAAVSPEAELVVAETRSVARSGSLLPPRIQLPNTKQRKRSFVEQHGLSTVVDSELKSRSSSLSSRSNFRDMATRRRERTIGGAKELAIALVDPSDGSETASEARVHTAKGKTE